MVTLASQNKNVLHNEISDKQSNRTLFYEPSLKGNKENEYGRLRFEAMTTKQQVQAGFEVLKDEIEIWKGEWKERMMGDVKVFKTKEENILYKFDSQEIIDEWRTACDGDWKEGYSTCEFKLSKTGHGLFTGYLDSERMPKDGRINRTGWANFSAPEARRSFFRWATYNWGGYTHVVMRVRGDGRHYLINLNTKGQFDVTWFQIFKYILHTHGGPYWQYVKIPLTKFIFTYKGRVQDKQYTVPVNSITSYGFTLMDGNTGPFSLEIDYIGLVNDPSCEEQFVYEKYYVPEAKWADITHTTHPS